MLPEVVILTSYPSEITPEVLFEPQINKREMLIIAMTS